MQKLCVLCALVVNNLMGELASIITGAVICLVVPIVSMSIGLYLGRNGMPIEIRWRRHADE